LAVDIQHSVIAGLVGTAAMTLFMYGMTFLTDRVMKVVKILGTMLTFQTSPEGRLSDSPLAIGVGIIAHFAIGVIFALIYYELWRAGIGSPTVWIGALFGFISGLVAMLVWRLFFALHPKPPTTVPLKNYLITLLVAHVVFGVVVVATYQLLSVEDFAWA
jgi:hypothetical protein